MGTALCVSLCSAAHIFCPSYCTAISTSREAEIIVPAHADSIIRHSGHPEKKTRVGKRVLKVWEMVKRGSRRL